jgi:hypothetical protein
MVCSILFAGVLWFPFRGCPFFATVAHVSWLTSRTSCWVAGCVSLLIVCYCAAGLLFVWGTSFAFIAGVGWSLEQLYAWLDPICCIVFTFYGSLLRIFVLVVKEVDIHYKGVDHDMYILYFFAEVLNHLYPEVVLEGGHLVCEG